MSVGSARGHHRATYVSSKCWSDHSVAAGAYGRRSSIARPISRWLGRKLHSAAATVTSRSELDAGAALSGFAFAIAANAARHEAFGAELTSARPTRTDSSSGTESRYIPPVE